MDRTRYRNTVRKIAYGPQVIVNEDGSRHIDAGPRLVSHTTVAEKMVDLDTRKTRSTKPCLHVKARATCTTPRICSNMSGSAPYRRWFENTAAFDAVLPTQGPTVSRTVSDLQAFKDAVEGVFNESIVGPVALKEAPQIRSTLNELRKAEFGRKQFANKFLAYKFGILPVLSDLEALVSQIPAMRNHISQVNNSLGGGYRAVVPAGTVSGDFSYTVPTIFNTSETRTVQWGGKAKFWVTGKVARRYSRGDIIRAYLDFAGATFASSAWDMIPYSFVVDYVVNVGGFINYLTPRFQEPVISVTDAGSSVKANVSYPCYKVDTRTNEIVNTGSMEIDYFSRSPGVPSLSSIIEDKILSLSRLSTSTALLLQKLK